MGFFSQLARDIGNDAKVASERGSSAEFSGWIDTGSYVLNAQVSGTIYGGLPNNKISALAGAEATGKTYYALGLARHFQNTHTNAGIYYYDTESATTADMMVARGIDPERVLISEPLYIQQFNHMISKTCLLYTSPSPRDRQKSRMPSSA